MLQHPRDLVGDRAGHESEPGPEGRTKRSVSALPSLASAPAAAPARGGRPWARTRRAPALPVVLGGVLPAVEMLPGLVVRVLLPVLPVLFGVVLRVLPVPVGLAVLVVLADDRRSVVRVGVGVRLLALGTGRLVLLLLLLLLLLVHRSPGHPSGIRQQRLRLLGVLTAERAAVVGVVRLAGEREVAADRDGGQAQRAQDGLDEFVAVDRAGDGAADALVGERPSEPFRASWV